MKDLKASERINIGKLDAKAIQKITSDVTRVLTEAAQKDPEAQAKFHVKLGHLKAGFSRSSHTEIIIGGPEPDEPAGD